MFIKNQIKTIMNVAGWGILFLVVIFQFMPYGHNHTNPPVVAEPQWDNPQTRATFVRACGDCHSNETIWPWYSHVAPVSWFVQNHVESGRRHLNVSEWGKGRNHAKHAAEEVTSGDMPLSSYLLLHSNANLNQTEKEDFIKGLQATFGKDN